MLLTRQVDDCAQRLCAQLSREFVVSCQGYEAAQVGTAVCIEVGKDFTLPYYRDLGVVLTIGMTPEEVFRTYTQAYGRDRSEDGRTGPNGQDAVSRAAEIPPWGYHKHNMVTGSTPVATHILHAAGIAFASKLRKAEAVTVAYCGDGATAEPDFLEGISFAAQHQLPLVIVCEQDEGASSLQSLPLPAHLEYKRINGTDVVAVYEAMHTAMQYAREGRGPVLLAMNVHRLTPAELTTEEECYNDPLWRCQQYLQERGLWDEAWAAQLHTRLAGEVEQAMHHALGDMVYVGGHHSQ
ncbi:MAG: thiamine pyrophosphate-dependent dehydrogenase E1 component subunit alpha [Ktedonobacteraceae bacterium]